MSSPAQLTKQHKPRFVDTTFLWAVDGVFDGEIPDLRARECFGYLCDAAIDPNYTLVCIVPSKERVEEGTLPLPAFYHAFTRAKLISTYVVVNPTARATQKQILGHVRRLTEQCEKQPTVVRSWVQVHLHKKVRKGWEWGVPDTSTAPEFRYIPDDVVRALTTTQGKKYLNRIIKATKLDTQGAALGASIVSRGWAYAQGAEELGGEYLTHPERWQVSLDHRVSAKLPATRLGPVLGGILLDALKAEAFRKDADFLAEKVARIRQNAPPFCRRLPVFAP